MPGEKYPFKIPADDVERANIGTVNPDCPQCSVWGFECKLPKCGPQVHEKGTHEFAGLGEAAQAFAKARFDSMEPRAFKLDEKGTIIPNPEYARWQDLEKHKYVARAMYENRPATQADFKREISKLTGEEIFHKPVTSLNYCARASLAKQPWKCGRCQREIFSKESHIKGCVGREIYTDDGKAIINWYNVTSKTYPVRVEKKQERSCTCHPADRSEFDECQGGFSFADCCRIANDKRAGGEAVPPETAIALVVISAVAIVVIVLMEIFYRG